MTFFFDNYFYGLSARGEQDVTKIYIISVRKIALKQRFEWKVSLNDFIKHDVKVAVIELPSYSPKINLN